MAVTPSLRCPRQAALSLAFVTLAFSVHAESPDAGSLLREQKNLQRQLPARLPEPVKEEIRKELTDTGGESIVVKSVRFTGATNLVPEADLHRLVSDVAGKSLTFSQLNQSAQHVTDYLKSQGYMLARAYLPRQDVSKGAIEIAILQGRLDEGGVYRVVPENAATLRIRPEVLSNIGAAALRPGEPLRQAHLERAVLLMNDLPGIRAKARLEPGSAPDTTRVLLDVSEKPLVGFSGWLDNYGERSAGVARANASLVLNDPFRIGDRVGLTGSLSEGINYWQLGYGLPVGSSGLKMGIDFSGMNYRLINGTGAAAGLNGESQTQALNASYPFVRGRSVNLYGGLTYAQKAFKNLAGDAVLNDKRAKVLTLGLSGDAYDHLGGGGQTYFRADLGAGSMDLSHNAGDAQADSAGYRAAGDFMKLNYSLGRLQGLPENFSLYAGISGQYANKNLDTSEKFVLGGPTALRAYSGGEASGDEGWLANLELRYELPALAFGQPRLVGFYDIGGITLHKNTNGIPIPTASGENEYHLSGAGIGAEISKGDRYQVRLMWARKLGGNPGRSVAGLNADGRDSDNQFWAQAAFWF